VSFDDDERQNGHLDKSVKASEIERIHKKIPRRIITSQSKKCINKMRVTIPFKFACLCFSLECYWMLCLGTRVCEDVKTDDDIC
jgi:hypothetical protein